VGQRVSTNVEGKLLDQENLAEDILASDTILLVTLNRSRIAILANFHISNVLY
jgi:hypothetical protein